MPANTITHDRLVEILENGQVWKVRDYGSIVTAQPDRQSSTASQPSLAIIEVGFWFLSNILARINVYCRSNTSFTIDPTEEEVPEDFGPLMSLLDSRVAIALALKQHSDREESK